jgi:hypothetical protein
MCLVTFDSNTYGGETVHNITIDVHDWGTKHAITSYSGSENFVKNVHV